MKIVSGMKILWIFFSGGGSHKTGLVKEPCLCIFRVAT